MSYPTFIGVITDVRYSRMQMTGDGSLMPGSESAEEQRTPEVRGIKHEAPAAEAEDTAMTARQQSRRKLDLQNLYLRLT